MYYGDHNPPHFHVKYNEFECFISIKNPKILEGTLPNKVEKMVIAWTELYNDELLKNWDLALKEKPLEPIYHLLNKFMIYNVINAEQINDTYHLKIKFNDGVVKDFDCTPYVGGSSFIFGPLKNKQTFKLFKVKDGTIVWETGADFCPNVLYERGKLII